MAQFLNHVQSAETLPGNVPAALHCSLGGELCIFSPLIPEASRLGVGVGPVPRDEGGSGSWISCTWPIREWLHPHSTDSGHVSVSELSPCKVSADVETATGVKSDSPETLIREADDMRGGCELANC